jgi:hypothetical protein
MKLILERGVNWYFLRDENGYSLDAIWRPTFERITGIKLKSGESRKIKSIKITLEPVKKKKVKK